MRTETISVDVFSEGMTSDIRDETNGIVKLLKHFDLLARPRSLTPYHSQVNADAQAALNQLTDFLYYGGDIFGRGFDTSDSHAFVKLKTDFTNTSWGVTSNNSGAHVAIDGVFVEYHGFAYGLYNGGKVWKYDLSGITGWDEDNASGAIGGATISAQRHANGIVHSKDDILYMAHNNVIASNNNGSWVNPALTLPSKYYITSLCEYGNYLAIACAPLNGGKSVVYLWDRDSTLTTLSDVIDFGFGVLQIIEQVGGELIGISLRTDFFNSLSSRLVFRSYAGATATVFRELIASSTTGLQLLYGQKFNANRLYFLAGIEIDGTLHNGIWGIGKNKAGRWIVWFDRLPNNDTAIAAGSLTGFFLYGDYALVSYNDSGYKLTMTSNSASAYAGSSIVETVINPGMTGKLSNDRSANKQLQVLAVAYDPIPSGGQIIIKWKVDGGSWNTARTETTTGRVVSEVPSTEASFTAGREYQFRIESTGGVIPTAIKYKYEALATLV